MCVCVKREREREREVRRRYWFIIMNWHLPLWKLTSPTVFCLQAGDPRKPVVGISRVSLRSENQESQWYNFWSKGRRRLRSQLQRSGGEKGFPSFRFLFYSSPRQTGRCPPTLERALCFTQLPIQMLIPSWIYSEITFKQLSGQVTLTHKISHHISTFFYVLRHLCLLFKNFSFMNCFWHCALGSKKKVSDGDAPWTPKPARSYMRTWQCILILKAVLKKFLLP